MDAGPDRGAGELVATGGTAVGGAALASVAVGSIGVGCAPAAGLRALVASGMETASAGFVTIAGTG
jgi:hypothetical protein